MKTLSVVGAVMITLVELGLYGYYTIRFDGFTSRQTITRTILNAEIVADQSTAIGRVIMTGGKTPHDAMGLNVVLVLLLPSIEQENPLMNSTILVVDDDPAIISGVTHLLTQAEYAVLQAATGAAALAAFPPNDPPSLVVLDVMLPDMDGYAVCRQPRALPSYIPVLMLSARDDTLDKVTGLDVGADDYLTKPFAPTKLLARVRALLHFAAQRTDNQPLVFGALSLDLTAHVAAINNEPLDLTATEWAVLVVLMAEPGRVYGRETLLNRVWAAEFLGDSRIVDVCIQRIRAKIAAIVVQQMHSIRPAAQVLVGPVRPWLADQNGAIPDALDQPWLNYFNTLVAQLDATIREKSAAGILLVAPDGFALNAFGRPEALSEEPSREPATDLSRPEWGAAQAGFRVYRDWLRIINQYPATRGAPAFISAANTYTPDSRIVPLQNYPAGWLPTAFDEINREPQVQALCWFVDLPFGDTWQEWSLAQPQGNLYDAAADFDLLLQR